MKLHLLLLFLLAAPGISRVLSVDSGSSTSSSLSRPSEPAVAAPADSPAPAATPVEAPAPVIRAACSAIVPEATPVPRIPAAQAVTFM